jgi:ribosomal protein S12 methylthiotransferase accessory factor
MNPSRRLVYRCIENLIQFEDAKAYDHSLELLYGKETLRQAKALLNRSERFFDLVDLGENMEASSMHQSLLKAYDKLFA